MTWTRQVSTLIPVGRRSFVMGFGLRLLAHGVLPRPGPPTSCDGCSHEPIVATTATGTVVVPSED